MTARGFAASEFVSVQMASHDGVNDDVERRGGHNDVHGSARTLVRLPSCEF